MYEWPSVPQTGVAVWIYFSFSGQISSNSAQRPKCVNAKSDKMWKSQEWKLINYCDWSFIIIYIDCTVASTPSDVQIDRSVDRSHKQGTWYVRWSMPISAILEFCAPFRNFSVPDFRRHRRLFHVHALSRQLSKSLWMDSHMFDCYWCKLDFFQTADEVMCTLSRAHFDLMPDTFHVVCNRLRAGLEYLLENHANRIDTDSLAIKTGFFSWCNWIDLVVDLLGSALDGYDHRYSRYSHKLAPDQAMVLEDHYSSDTPMDHIRDDKLYEYLQKKIHSWITTIYSFEYLPLNSPFIWILM